MERFVFVAAVTIAIISAAFYFLGKPSFSIDIGHFEGHEDPMLEASAGRLEAQTFSASAIEVKHAAAQVVITPEDRQDVVVEIDNPGGAPMPEVRLEAGALVIDGRLRRRIEACREETVDLRGYGEVARTDLPRINIRAPRTLSLEVGAASNAEIGPSQSLNAWFSGCGDAQIGDVTDGLEIDLSGSGTVRAGAARRLDADLAGSGELQAGAIGESAEIDIAGSGTVRVASVSGALTVDGAGSGDVSIAGGAITEAEIDLAGSGNVVIAAPVRRLTVSIVGSGDVAVEGAVGDIDADIAGSGDISAQSITGAVRKEVWGSGDVRIGRQTELSRSGLTR